MGAYRISWKDYFKRFHNEYEKDKTDLVNKQLIKMLKELKKAGLFKFKCFQETKSCFEFMV